MQRQYIYDVFILYFVLNYIMKYGYLSAMKFCVVKCKLHYKLQIKISCRIFNMSEKHVF